MFIRTPNAPSESLVFEEVDGLTLTLNDRFLPYRPITVGGKQRAEFTWYPGSPEATVQMLGPEEDTIQLRGFWKDKFLQIAQSVILTAAPANAASLSFIDSVSGLVQVVDDMRRMGRQIKLSWGAMQRVGHIVSFRQTWHNIHDCEWELDFAVLSQGETTVPAVIPTITLPDVYQVALDAAVTLQDRIIEQSGLPVAVSLSEAASLALNIANLNILAVADAMTAIVQGYAGSVFSVSQSARRTVSTLSGGIKNLAVSIGSVGDTALSEFYSWGNGDEDNTAVGQLVAAFNFKRNVTSQIQTSRYAYADSRAKVAREAAGAASQVQQFLTVKDMDYRDISLQFYGTSDRWLDLMRYNGATDSKLAAGTQVFIPPASLLTRDDIGRGG